MHRPWESVKCVCDHGAGKHGSNITGTGCMSFDPVTREGCGCTLDREEVLYTALQRVLAEVCEHNEQRRTRRADLR
jgi:hypothetical protein